LPESPTDSANEITGEAKILSFIVRVWREESPSKKRQAVWRGHITPIPDGERHYFTNIKEIPDLIATHLKVQR